MRTLESADRPEFWADVYCGKPIAIFNRHGRWHVYLDHILQHDVLFATPEDAIVWLTERVDQVTPARPSLPQ